MNRCIDIVCSPLDRPVKTQMHNYRCRAAWVSAREMEDYRRVFVLCCMLLYYFLYFISYFVSYTLFYLISYFYSVLYSNLYLVLYHVLCLILQPKLNFYSKFCFICYSEFNALFVAGAIFWQYGEPVQNQAGMNGQGLDLLLSYGVLKYLLIWYL